MSRYRFENHILNRHGFDSVATNKSKFIEGFDMKKGIESAMKGDNFIVKPNTGNRGGYIFERTFNNQIGTNAKGKPINTVKVVIGELGNVITAFQKK